MYVKYQSSKAIVQKLKIMSRFVDHTHTCTQTINNMCLIFDSILNHIKYITALNCHPKNSSINIQLTHKVPPMICIR